MASSSNRKSSFSDSRKPNSGTNKRRSSSVPKKSAIDPSRPRRSNTAPQRGSQRTMPPRSSATRSSGSRDYSRSNSELSSVRIGDLDQTRRVHRIQKSYRRHVARLAFIAVVIVLLLVGGIVLYSSNVFTVENVTVKGAEHLTSDELTELASVPQGTTLLRLDADSIKARLMKNPWIKDVNVNRAFPNTVELAITEKTIVAIVDVPSNNAQTTERWAIASDGMWLMSIPDQNSEEGRAISSQVYEDAQNVLHITAVPYGISPKAGTYNTDNNVRNALAIVDGFSTSLADQVKTVSATGTDTTTLILKNGIEISFGSAENIREKERVSLQLMEQYAGKITFINVRVVDKPTWRSA